MVNGGTSVHVPGLGNPVLGEMNVTACRDQGRSTFTLKAVHATAKMVVMLQAHYYLSIS